MEPTVAEPADLSVELATICAAIHIESPSAFTFAGRRLEATSTGHAADPEGRLQQQLYEHCYSRRFHHRPAEPAADTARDWINPSFVQELDRANPRGDRLDAGWRVERLEATGQVTATKGGKVRVLVPGQYVHGGPPGMPQPGSEVSTYQARGSAAFQPGFYYAFGSAAGDQLDHAASLRLYWNVRAAGAARLTSELVRRLDAYQVPFSFKTLASPAHYDRADGSVLFFARRYFPLVADLAAAVWRRLADQLGQDTPLFTKRLAPGLGLAEDPANGSSFGLVRCSLLSHAVWTAHRRGDDSVPARLAAIEQMFDRHGLSLERPYLNPRSVDRYPFPDPGSPHHVH